MHSLFDGQRLPLGQLGPHIAILTSPAMLHPAVAEMEMTVDGRTSRWSIRLDESVGSDSRRFGFQPGPDDQ
ncbi:MAG: hypothetical protein ACYTGL_08305 [Planctomycetota bacterium]|jgi:hypothetical protein